MKRFTHDADLRGMVVLRSLGFQLVPFKLHRFRKQRRYSRHSVWKAICGEVRVSHHRSYGARLVLSNMGFTGGHLSQLVTIKVCENGCN
ncbi:hypothetical protein [Aeromonas salmonicida]|uniref:hypothetical protein n=1 Tax=Aeromonas salmonicida TaxID=645 RepID=UPI001462847C|nr:hypothetical protein [Aeromonas salmonicida]QJF54483.1 hypothetical protein GO993_12640 [Aeromonas salmonicida subsp. salmonicida]